MPKPFYRNALDRTGKFVMLDVRLLQLPAIDIKIYSILMEDAITNYNGNHAKLPIREISTRANIDKNTVVASVKRLIKKWNIISRRKTRNTYIYYFLAPKSWTLLTLNKKSQTRMKSKLVDKINEQLV